MVNFLALLGWSPGSGDRELFTRDELVGVFALEGISGGNAVFNAEKLDWFNQQHIMRLAPDELARAAEAVVRSRRALARRLSRRSPRLVFRRARAAEAARQAARRFRDAVGRFFFTDTIEYDEAAVDEAPARRTASASISRRSTPRSRALDDVRCRVDRGGAAVGRGARGVKAASLIHAVAGSRDGKNGKSWTLRRHGAARPRSRARDAWRQRFDSRPPRVPSHSVIFPIRSNSLTRRRLRARRRNVFHSLDDRPVRRAENVFLSSLAASMSYRNSWHIGCSPSVRAHCARTVHASEPGCAGPGRRARWLKKIVDLLRWTGTSSAISRARAARRRIRRAPRTSGRARKRARPGRKGGMASHRRKQEQQEAAETDEFAGERRNRRRRTSERRRTEDPRDDAIRTSQCQRGVRLPLADLERAIIEVRPTAARVWHWEVVQR